ncbi:hypothetical protein Asch01_00466 [Acinetobacter schindleri]
MLNLIFCLLALKGATEIDHQGHGGEVGDNKDGV